MARLKMVASLATCVVMVLLAAVPLVGADTHQVIKGAQGPRASAVSWQYSPIETGVWTGHVVNAGLRSIVVDVSENTTGAGTLILHQRIRFAETGDIVTTSGVHMAKNHKYSITVTPNGPKGSSCTVDDSMMFLSTPVAVFTYGITGEVVSVDGSSSYDPNPGESVMEWGWEWGDGTVGTGKIATHPYSASGTYTITLTVLSTTGMTGSTSHDVIFVMPIPILISRFTYTVSGSTVSFDASLSTSDPGIVSYAWNFGDSVIASGVMHTHIYIARGAYTVILTVTDTLGNTDSSHKVVTLGTGVPPDSYWYLVMGTTYASDGVTPIAGCAVTVTNERTGETLTGLQSDGTGMYFADVTYLTTNNGDSLLVRATSPYGQTGSATGVVDYLMYGMGVPMTIDVTLS